MAHLPRSRHRSIRALLAILVAASVAALSACGASGDSGDSGASGSAEESSSSPSAGGNFPATVSTKFGDVTVSSKPKRVVALGWGDAATAIALGVQPVGASDWLGFGGDGLGPWVKDGYTTKPTIIGTLEPSYEKIWDLHPDLILDVKSSGDQKRYDMLSKIAPTIGIPEGADDYMTGMTTQVKMIAAALGKPEKGAALLADIDQRFGDAAAAHPQFKGKTVSVSALSGGGWGAYIASTDRVRFLHRLGFENSPTINAAKPEGFTVPISAEKLSMLDADLVVSMPIGKPASAIADNPVFEQIPAVKAGRYLVLGNADVRAAYSTNTVLSIPYALDKMVPMLAAKLKS